MDVATVSLKVRSCDTNNKVFDESSSPTNKSSSQRTAHRSRWFVGSSRTKMSPPLNSAPANETRFRSPPLKSETRRSWRCSTLSLAAAVATAASTAQPSCKFMASAARSKLFATLTSSGFASYAAAAAA